MNLASVYLAAEDAPGLAVGRKLITETSRLSVYREENGCGFGTLRRNIQKYARMSANGFPVLLITDLDRDVCPSAKILEWLGSKPDPRFVFRICVREIESWLLADREAMAGFLKIRIDAVPTAPESLPDPKAKLIELAQKAPRKLRVGMTPRGSASIGPEYNDLLEGFIAHHCCAPTETYPCGVSASPREPSALANRPALTLPYPYSYSARRAVLVLDPLLSGGWSQGPPRHLVGYRWPVANTTSGGCSGDWPLETGNSSTHLLTSSATGLNLEP